MSIYLGNPLNTNPNAPCQRVAQALQQAIDCIEQKKSPNPQLTFLGIDPADQKAHKAMCGVLPFLKNARFTRSDRTDVLDVRNGLMFLGYFSIGERSAHLGVFKRALSIQLLPSPSSIPFGIFCTATHLPTSFSTSSCGSQHLFKYLFNGSAVNICPDPSNQKTLGAMLGIFQPALTPSNESEKNRVAFEFIFNLICSSFFPFHPRMQLNWEDSFSDDVVQELKKTVQAWDIKKIMEFTAAQIIDLFDEPAEEGKETFFTDTENNTLGQTRTDFLFPRIPNLYSRTENPNRNLLLSRQQDVLRFTLTFLKRYITENQELSQKVIWESLNTELLAKDFPALVLFENLEAKYFEESQREPPPQ